MKFTEIKDFDLTDDFFSGDGYLNSSIIEIFDRSGVLDLMRNIYIERAIANKVDMLAGFSDFDDLLLDVVDEVCSTLTITDIWELCSAYTIDKCVLCSKTNNINHIDNIIIQIINEALHDLILYCPVDNFFKYGIGFVYLQAYT